MASHLAKIKDNFIMSINDVPEIGSLFASFTIIEAQVNDGSTPFHSQKRFALLLCFYAILCEKPVSTFSRIALKPAVKLQRWI